MNNETDLAMANDGRKGFTLILLFDFEIDITLLL